MTCKDCTKRHRACHDTCEDYKKFKEEIAAQNKKRLDGWEYFSYMKDSYLRTKKRKNR